MASLAAAGFKTVINNRPDAEVSPDLQSDAMRSAAEAAGIAYVANPVINGAMTMAMVELQGQTCQKSPGPVFAWCRSGTRSSIVWALAHAGEMPAAEITSALSNAGYDIPGLAEQIESLSKN